MRKPVKRVAVVHDLCGVGKAALTNIIPVLSIMGVEVCPIPTMLLSTHTGGFGNPSIVKLPNYIDECDEHYSKYEIDFDALLIGYLGSDSAIDSAIKFIERNKSSNIVIDPIFGDHGKCYSNFDMIYVQGLKRLIAFADIITPNYTEACLLTGEDYIEDFSFSRIEKICNKLIDLGAKNIVITSLPSKLEKDIGIAIYEKGELSIISKEKKGEAYPGTGDIFTSVLIGERLRGKSLIESCEKAHNFVSECIEESSKFDYPRREGVLLEKKLYLLVNK
ncbi:pyridoxamine kinase [Clostridium sp. LP20]|uniref:pyridoxamine kinase n=1 Tax=Clostridium sp. LP20 TaxID=3418665 RepID=UPI003EE5D561